MIGVFCITYFGLQREKKLLNSCSEKTTAIIVDKHSRSNRGYFMIYRYEVDGIKYESSSSLSGKEIDSLQEGHTIKIRYSCNDHSVSSFKKQKENK